MKEGIKRLPREFIGKGEVKGFHFNQLLRTQNYCLYKVTNSGNTHYEVFEIKVYLLPITKEPYESYPTVNSFGVWAWTYANYNKAIEKLNNLTNDKIRSRQTEYNV